jgi:hypothetical protein
MNAAEHNRTAGLEDMDGWNALFGSKLIGPS